VVRRIGEVKAVFARDVRYTGVAARKQRAQQAAIAASTPPDAKAHGAGRNARRGRRYSGAVAVPPRYPSFPRVRLQRKQAVAKVV